MMDDQQRTELEELHKQLVDSMNKLSPVINDIAQLILADNALRAGDQKLFNYIMENNNE